MRIQFEKYNPAWIQTFEQIKIELIEEQLSIREWRDGNEYNEWKDNFIKREERKAVDWYMNTIKVISVR